VTRGAALLAAALAASVGLNAWLWSRGGARAESREARAAADAPRDHASDSTASPALDDPACTRDLLGEDAELAAVQHQLDGVLSLDEKFKDAEPNQALEKRLHDRFAKAFVGAPEGLTWQVECRANLCKVEMLFRMEQFTLDWQEKAQRGLALDGLATSMSVSGGPPPGVGVNPKKVIEYDILDDIGDPDGVLEPIAAAFHASDGLHACEAQYPDRGFVGLRLDLAAGSTQVEATLMPQRTDFGACALSALSRLAAAAHASAGSYDAELPVWVSPPTTGAPP
jgi:hypothetical protein